MFLLGIGNKKSVKKLVLDKIAIKLFNYPGFFEGVMEASAFYQYNSEEQFEAVWKDIKKFLKYYQYTAPAVSDNGICVEVIFPFRTKEDIELVRLIMMNYLN